MSGVIQVEGKSDGVIHPELGELITDAALRRTMKDFPPVVWLTTQINIPNCLRNVSIAMVDNKTGEIDNQHAAGHDIANGLALNRVALGFKIAEISSIPWPEHYGYRTDEGKELNESAREVGDNPDDWHVSEKPVDVLKINEFWASKAVFNPKLKRFDSYIQDIHKMVALAKERGAYIPPSWMSP